MPALFIQAVAAAAAAIVLLLLQGCSTQSRDPNLLSLLPPTTGQLRGNEKVEFEFHCAEGQTVLLRVLQDNVDVMVEVHDARNATIDRVDTPAERFGHETLVMDCAHRDTYKARLIGKQEDAPGGTFTLSVQAFLPGIEYRSKEGFEALARAGRLHLLKQQNAWREAAASLRHVIGVWSRMKWQKERAEAEYQLGALLYLHLYEWQDAVRHARESRGIYASIGDAWGTASASVLLGAALQEAARGVGSGSGHLAQRWLDESEQLLVEAAASCRKRGRHFDAAMAQDYLAITHYYRGDLPGAAAFFAEAERALLAINEKPAQLMVLQNLATLQYERGAYADAAQAFDRLIPLISAEEDSRTFAATLHNSAEVHLAIGNVEVSLDRELEVLELQKQRGDPGGQARSLHALGKIYMRLDDLQRALVFFNKALPMEIETGQGRYAFATSIALGNLWRQLGDTQRALSQHRDARRFARTAGEHARLSLAMGVDYRELGMNKEALAEFERAVGKVSASAGYLHAEALIESGRMLLGLKQYGQALHRLDRALQLAKREHNLLQQGNALTQLALTHRASGDPGKALELVSQALDHYETLKGRAISPDIKTAFLASKRAAFELHVDLTLQGVPADSAGSDGQSLYGNVVGGLVATERGRAGTLLDAFSTGATSGSEKDVIARREVLYADLAGRKAVMDRLLDSDNPSAKAIERLAIEISTLRSQVDLMEGQIRGVPARAAAGKFDANSIRLLQGSLPANVDIVVFYLGEERSWAWILNRQSIEVVRLPAAAHIAALVTEARATFGSPPAASRDPQPIIALAQDVVGPLLPYLNGERVLIVPDGVLQLVPFSAVFRYSSARNQHPVVALVPSLALLSQKVTDHQEEGPSRVLVLAESGSRTVVAGSPAYLFSVEGEINAIRTAIGTDKVHVVPASRTSFLQAPLNEYSMIHIASHAVLDNVEPRLSRVLLGAGEDLRASDIALMKMPSQLVVLSACQETSIAAARRDGLTVFAQSFMLAGARNVVVSLWKVSDIATAALMGELYSAMAKGGRDPAQALRYAQEQVSHDKRWADPYYWAGFVVVTRKLD